MPKSKTARRKASGGPVRPRRAGRPSDDANVPVGSKIAAFAKEAVITLVVVLFIQTFAFGFFHVPTPSMAQNILVGDRLIASKLHYGGRTPSTVGIPFTNIYLKGFELPAVRIPGFSRVKRGDVVVFNFPPEEEPIERKEHYVKRAVGLPGDALEIRDKVVLINGEVLPDPPGAQQHYVAVLSSSQVNLPISKLRELGVSDMQQLDPTRLLLFELTRETADEIASWPYVERVEPFVLPKGALSGSAMFPAGKPFNTHQYGPITIPAEGDEVKLTADNWTTYEELITRFEGHQARMLADGSFEVDGVKTDRYSVEQDYYFMMGDNRDNSLDSRSWGFVPADHVSAKVLVTYFSWDADRSLPRFGRIARLVH